MMTKNSIPPAACRLALPLLFLVGVAAARAADQAPRTVNRIKILADKAPDCSSLKSIVETVTRGCGTNDEKAVAIYNTGRLLWYHRQYPGEKGGIAALKMINVYGWSLCGGQHTVLAALWRAAGWDWRYIGWRGHTTVECRYDGQWHYFDTFLKVYAWKPAPDALGGRTVASQADIKSNPDLITDRFVQDKARGVWYVKDNRFEIIDDKANWVAPAFFVCGDQPPGVVKGVQKTSVGGTSVKLGHMGLKFNEDGYTTDVDLAPGGSLELMWKPVDEAHWWNGRKYKPGHTCGDKDYRNCPAIGPILEPYRYLNPRGARTFSSGYLRFAPDLGNEACLSGLADRQNVKWSPGRLAPADAARPASITVRLQSPYIMSRAKSAAPGIDKAEVSTDEGKTWKQVEAGNFDDAVGGRYDCLLKLTFARPVTSLSVEVIVQHNRCALPYLSPGRNEITVSVADPKQLGLNRLAVTYAYCLGSRDRSYEEIADRGAEIARAHYARWSATPTVVRKVFTADDLPAKLTIDVPTPKGKHPVYPRMLFLRREVLSDGAEPMPLPEGAAEPKTGAGGELKTLPNPFLVGLAEPPKRIERPTTQRKVSLWCSHVVKTDGTVYDNNYIKWRPKKYEAWVMLVGGQIKDLPAPRDVKSAHLCFPVTDSNPKATTQVGCTLLKAAFEKGKSYDFKDLGDVIGTVNVPKQPGPGEAKYHRIDVTRAIKRLAAGEAEFHGFCIRTIPNRAVDDGWTTRIDVTKGKPTYLELRITKR